MSTLGNILWFLLGGLWACIYYWVLGLFMCLTIIGIPFGIQLFKIGKAICFPFGKELRALPDADSPLRVLMNVIWIFLFGWELAVGHLVFAVVLAITIIGIPFAQQHIKHIPLALLPFGRELVPIDAPREAPAAGIR